MESAIYTKFLILSSKESCLLLQGCHLLRSSSLINSDTLAGELPSDYLRSYLCVTLRTLEAAATFSTTQKHFIILGPQAVSLQPSDEDAAGTSSFIRAAPGPGASEQPVPSPSLSYFLIFKFAG